MKANLNPKEEVRAVARKLLDIDLANRSPLAPAEVTAPMLEKALLEVWRRATNHGYELGYDQGGTEMRESITSRTPADEF